MFIKYIQLYEWRLVIFGYCLQKNDIVKNNVS